MKCITDIRRIYEELRMDIERDYRDEEESGPFDDEWTEDMQAREYIANDLKHIIQEHEFWLEQHNK